MRLVYNIFVRYDDNANFFGDVNRNESITLSDFIWMNITWTLQTHDKHH